MVKAVPDGSPQLTPYLIVDGAADAIEFYSSVLGAKERMRMDGPEGKVGHAELELGDSLIMLADEYAEMNALSPRAIGGSPVSLHVYVEDADAVFQKALDAGAKEVRPLEDKFYGDRLGSFEDPFGHQWHVASHIEDVPLEEMERRAAEAAGAG
jgi:PhnB protein